MNKIPKTSFLDTLFSRTFYIFLILSVVLGGSLHAQNTANKKINISLNNAKLSDLFATIEKESDYRFTYESSSIDLNTPVSVSYKNTRIETILDETLSRENLTYEILGNQIAVKKKINTPQNDNGGKTQKIKGVVYDAQGSLLGATVVIKGSSRGTITDDKGQFELEASENDILLVSFLGATTKEVVVGKHKNFKIMLEKDNKMLEEVTIVGYGSQKKRTVTGAISSMKTEDIANIAVSNLSNALAGRLAGVNVIQSTGTPGVSADIKIRANGSWNGSNPTYVINGVVSSKADFDALDQSEVANISVLKDVASAAIYGARGGNGVILVKTRRGKKGKPTFQFSTSMASDHPTQIPEMADDATTIMLENFQAGSPNNPVYITDDEKDYFMKNGTYNWYNAAYRDPVTTRNALNVSGGSDKVDYYIGGTLFNETGFLPNVDYKKYTLRSDITAYLTKDLTANFQISNSQGTRERFNFTYDYGSNDLNNLWGKLLVYNWQIPPTIDNKYTNPGWISNPIARMTDGGYWRDENQITNTQFSLEYNIPVIKGLSVKALYNSNVNNNWIKSYDVKHTVYNFTRTGTHNHIPGALDGTASTSGDPGRESLSEAYSKQTSYQFDGQINYVKNIGLHHIEGLFVYEQSEADYNNFNGGAYDFPIIQTDQFFATSSNNIDSWIGGSESQSARVSYISRLNYNYGEKYMLSASLRRDGSTTFAPGKRFGWFPAISGGWDVSKETFFKIEAIQQLKLRASYGLAGNDNTQAWRWLQSYGNGSSMYFGDGVQKGIAYGGIPNPNVTWEKSRALNFGIDTRFLKKFTFTAEYWEKHTYDILGPRIASLPISFGGNMPPENYGKANAHGLEFELAYNGQIKDVHWYAKANMAYAVAKIAQQDFAQNGQEVDNPNGKYVDYVKGYVSKGILRTDADLQKLKDQYGNGKNFGNFSYKGQTPALGSLDYEDISGPNGKLDGTIDDYDRVVLAKHSQNPYTYGISFGADWKGLAVDVFLQGATGGEDFYKNSGFGRNAPYGGNRPYAFWGDCWRPDNVNGAFPMAKTNAIWNGPDTWNSSFWLYSKAYMRLKNIQLSYSLPKKLIRKVGFTKVQIYCSGTNLLTFTKFKFYDPELNDAMSYPTTRTITLGLNVTL